MLKKSIRDWKSLNNQNDPTAFELMRRNKQRHGVGYGPQLKHAAKALLILPTILVLGKLGDILTAAPIHPALKLAAFVGAIVLAVRWFVRDMERTDPVERAKQTKLLPGVRYHVERGRGIVDEAGNVVE